MCVFTVLLCLPLQSRHTNKLKFKHINFTRIHFFCVEVNGILIGKVTSTQTMLRQSHMHGMIIGYAHGSMVVKISKVVHTRIRSYNLIYPTLHSFS